MKRDDGVYIGGAPPESERRTSSSSSRAGFIGGGLWPPGWIVYCGAMGIDEIIGDKREEVLRIVQKHGVHTVRVFGSVARGEAGPDSDVDFLIEAGANVTPWFPGATRYFQWVDFYREEPPATGHRTVWDSAGASGVKPSTAQPA